MRATLQTGPSRERIGAVARGGSSVVLALSALPLAACHGRPPASHAALQVRMSRASLGSESLQAAAAFCADRAAEHAARSRALGDVADWSLGIGLLSVPVTAVGAVAAEGKGEDAFLVGGGTTVGVALAAYVLARVTDSSRTEESGKAARAALRLARTAEIQDILADISEQLDKANGLAAADAGRQILALLGELEATGLVTATDAAPVHTSARGLLAPGVPAATAAPVVASAQGLVQRARASLLRSLCE